MSVYKASKLLGQPVFVLGENTKKPEKLSHILINPDNGQVLAAITKHGVFTIKEICEEGERLFIKALPLEGEEKDE